MSVQGTFKLLPGVARSDVNNGAIRPMTSKQVKKAHKAATRQPKLSRAEQRRLELAEQERIRKEFEKERTAARARAARERKKQKELADKEAKRKNGLPLVAPRPSQETLSRFMWGNGSGLKRDGRGTTVAPAPMAAVAEESEAPVLSGNNCEGADSVTTLKQEPDLALDDTVGGAGAEEEKQDRTASPKPSPVAAHPEPKSGVQVGEESLQPAHSHIAEPAQVGSPHGISPRPSPGHAQPEPQPGVRVARDKIQPAGSHVEELGQLGPPLTTSPRPSSGQVRSESQPEVQEARDPSWATNGHVGEPHPTDLPRSMTPRPSISLVHPGPQPAAEVEEEPLKSAGSGGSFILGSSDMIDDESLIELTELLERKPVSAEHNITAPSPGIPDPEEDLQDDLQDDLADLGAITQLFPDMDDDYGYGVFEDRALETMNDRPSEEVTLPPQKPRVDNGDKLETISEQVSPHPQRSQRRRLERKVSSFFGSELDDETLLQLELPGEVRVSQPCQPIDEPPPPPSPPYKSPLTEKQTIGSAVHPATPSSPLAPRQRPPPSTQAILLNLDDYLPSSTQLALELEEDIMGEDFPVDEPAKQEKQQPQASRPGHLPSLMNAQTLQQTMAAPPRVTPPIRPQKRFFSSSGSNESLHLALHLSRRSAALDDIRRNERRRLEAGLLQGQRRTITQPSMHQQKRQKIPSFPTNYQVGRETPAKETTGAARTTTDEGVARPALTNPHIPTKNIQPTGGEHSGTKPAVGMTTNVTNKENVRPERGDDDLLGSGLPASQETEYGGAWIDDIGVDLVF